MSLTHNHIRCERIVVMFLVDLFTSVALFSQNRDFYVFIFLLRYTFFGSFDFYSGKYRTSVWFLRIGSLNFRTEEEKKSAQSSEALTDGDNGNENKKTFFFTFLSLN